MTAIVQVQRTQHNIPIDSATARRSTYRAQVTLQPREDGAYNADDAIVQPEQLVLECTWSSSDNPRLLDTRSGQSRLEAIEADLRDARREPLIVAVVDEPIRFDYLLQDISIERDNRDGLRGTLTFVGALFATTEIGGTAAPQRVDRSAADAAAGASEASEGAATPVNIPISILQASLGEG